MGRTWEVIKLSESDYAAHGVLIQGPRCEDETLVSLSEVIEALHRDFLPLSSVHEMYGRDAVEFIEREFRSRL